VVLGRPKQTGKNVGTIPRSPRFVAEGSSKRSLGGRKAIKRRVQSVVYVPRESGGTRWRWGDTPKEKGLPPPERQKSERLASRLRGGEGIETRLEGRLSEGRKNVRLGHATLTVRKIAILFMEGKKNEGIFPESSGKGAVNDQKRGLESVTHAVG